MQRTIAIVVAALCFITSAAADAQNTIQDMQRVLQRQWKPPGSCPRGFVVLSFNPSGREKRVTVHNSSQNKQFDDAAKALVEQLNGQRWNVPTHERWEITMHSDGTVKVQMQQDADFSNYMADLQRKIKKQWYPPKGYESKRVVIGFKIHSDGKMTNLKLDRPSGTVEADNAALRAAEMASPFRPLPPGAPDDVDIQFTFDYNVFMGSSLRLPFYLRPALPTKSAEDERVERDKEQKRLAKETIEANRALAQSLLPAWDNRNWAEALRLAEQFKSVDSKYTESADLGIWYVRYYSAKKLKLGKKELDAAVKLYGHGFKTPQKQVNWLDNNAHCRDEARRYILWWSSDKHDELL